jgi:uncharacterized protein YjiK
MGRTWTRVLALATACVAPDRSEAPRAAPEVPAPASPVSLAACLGGEPVKSFRLPPGLREISGLAVTADGRLLAHDDEHGEIGVIDVDSERIVKAFALGPRPASADFEGIAVAGDKVFLLVSDGRLVETTEGEAGQRVPFTIHDTGLGKSCEFEGLAYEPRDQSLLLLCKTAKMKELRGMLTAFRWSVPERRLLSPDRISVALPAAFTERHGRDFRGSALERHPGKGHYLALSSTGGVAVLFSRDGELIDAAPLSRTHEQPEGLAILGDGRLVVGDEGGKGAGTLTIYSCGL